MPVIMKDNVQYAYTTKGTVFHTLSNAEYEALTEEEKMNGDVYCIPDREPILNPDQVWAKIGTETLDIGSDLTDGVNQLNSSLEYKSVSNLFSIKSAYTSLIQITNQPAYRVDNIIYVYLELHRIGTMTNGEHDIIQCSVTPKFTAVFNKFQDDYGLIIQANGNGKFNLGTQNRAWYTLSGYILV